MYRSWKLWLGVPALALAAVLLTTNTASAQRGRGGRGYYGRGYYGNGYYGNGYYGNGYYGNRGYYGGYGLGYYGLGYGSGLGYGGYGNSGYYNNSSNFDPSYYYGQQPQGYSSFYQAPEAVPQNAAMVHVRVPANAELWFGGDRTSQTGSDREFVTPELKQDKDYTYTLKARWTGDDGEPVERTKRVKVHAGARLMVDFQ